MKIILSGGGTLGSVSPLIAVYQQIKKLKPEAKFLWLGTKGGPEKDFVKLYGLEFRSISSGKFRRYLSWQNFLDPFFVIFGFFQSINIIKKYKPDVIVSAGGFVSVPVVWAGWLFKVPTLIHQQDARAGLANKLMAPFAKKITVTFEKSGNNFPNQKVVWTGNPIRQEIFESSKDEATNFFNLEPNLPTVLILGGGTGSLVINKLVWQSLTELTKSAQIIHLTGKGKLQKLYYPKYHQFEFLTDKLKDAYLAADLVVCRASMSVLTELTALQKPVILIPIPESHQEDNAVEFAKNNAAVYLKQKELTPENFAEAITNVLNDKAQLQNLSRNIGKMMLNEARQKVAGEIIKLTKD